MRMFYSDEVGKKLYQQTIEYKVLIQQSVLASNRMEADNLFLNGGGLTMMKSTIQLLIKRMELKLNM